MDATLTRNLESLREQQARETNLHTEVLWSGHQIVSSECSAFELCVVQPTVRFEDLWPPVTVLLNIQNIHV